MSTPVQFADCRANSRGGFASLLVLLLITGHGATAGAAPVYSFKLGMSMIGGSIPDGGDDVGPANPVTGMILRDDPIVTVSGMVSTSWAAAQPNDPGSGPNVYDWSSLDAGASGLIAGKALFSYYQMWGTSPGWVQQDSTRFWQKFEQFIEEMTVYINQHHGAVYYVFENEPNISRAPDGWNWADWYIHCLQHFYPAVHRADARTGKSNKVSAGNLCGHSAGDFTTLYSKGLKNCSDILGYHAYPYDLRNGLEVSDLATIHGIQVTYNDANKQIWVSEGWGSGRSAGFDRSSPKIEPTAREVENMWMAMCNGFDNVMTARTNWQPSYLYGMLFFCGNDNWGAMNHRKRAIPIKDAAGNITGFQLDGYSKTPDIAPSFWNGGMLDFYGNSKDCLLHVFPGNGLVFMNPGFELASDPPRSNAPHFWTTQVEPPPAAVYGLDESVFHNGSRSIRLTQGSPDTNGVYQMTAKRSVQPGVSYRARVWCRTLGSPGATGSFYLRFCDLSGAVRSERYFAPLITGSADWQMMEAIATSPANASRAEVGCLIGGVGTVWFDDVTIAETSQQEVGSVRGYTLDENQGIVPNCLVKSTTGNAQAVSDQNGYYQIANLPTGTYDFVCVKTGYVPHRVKNQTIAAGKLLFVSFNMGSQKPGLAVTQLATDRDLVPVGSHPARVTVTIANSKLYPNVISEVSLFAEQNGGDVTNLCVISPLATNPRTVPANGSAQFNFLVSPRVEAIGQSFQMNAYVVGQEDRPNMLQNGGFDALQWNDHWTFSGGANPLTWQADSTDFVSPPRSLKCYVSDNEYTWNWANNWSAYGASAVPAHPARSYTVGVHHRDALSPGVNVDLFIQEYYYNAGIWLYNGRRFIAVPNRTTWAEDVMVYETGDPNVTQGLYATNQLVISCGPATTPTAGSGYSWWDDLYVKETGDWLADDRADSGVALTVGPQLSIADFDGDGDVDMADFAHLQTCLSGNGFPQYDTACADTHFDADWDVDETDSTLVQNCLSGSGIPADPACGNP